MQSTELAGTPRTLAPGQFSQRPGSQHETEKVDEGRHIQVCPDPLVLETSLNIFLPLADSS